MELLKPVAQQAETKNEYGLTPGDIAQLWRFREAVGTDEAMMCLYALQRIFNRKLNEAYKEIRQLQAERGEL